MAARASSMAVTPCKVPRRTLPCGSEKMSWSATPAVPSAGSIRTLWLLPWSPGRWKLRLTFLCFFKATNVNLLHLLSKCMCKRDRSSVVFSVNVLLYLLSRFRQRVQERQSSRYSGMCILVSLQRTPGGKRIQYAVDSLKPIEDKHWQRRKSHVSDILIIHSLLYCTFIFRFAFQYIQLFSKPNHEERQGHRRSTIIHKKKEKSFV